MNKNEARERIEKLKEVIRHHRYLYHVLDKQEISDEALDSLKHELFLLEKEYPEFVTLDSPTQRVGGEPLDKFLKAEHNIPMLSIEDVFTEEELFDWEKYLKRLDPTANFEYFCELKIDGFAISLIYENGILKRGATRGNGKIGEDVTSNIKVIESIPLSLEKTKIPAKLEIRGEIYMTKDGFEKINIERKKKGEALYSNPRNTAAGSIRQLDSKVVVERPLMFLAYDLVGDFGQTKHSEEHEILAGLGFRTDKYAKVCEDLKTAISFWKEVSKKRESLPFSIDGVVVNINDNSLFAKFGVAGKSPRGARAFKFAGKQFTTVIEGVNFQVGRTGAVTPVAHLKPVNIEGAIVSRATLHNEDEMKKLGIKIGDTVIIERAGDVIPAVVKVMKELRTGKEKIIRFPKKCPVCKTDLIKPEEEKVSRCPNLKCEARHRELFSHFTSKKAFDIEGFGPKIVNRLLDEGIIFEIPDIFKLKEEDLSSLERFAEKSASNLINAIKESRRVSFARFIYALGIRFVGEETAEDLSQVFQGIDNLMKSDIEDLEKIPDIGTRTANSIYQWFRKEKNKKLVEELIDAEVKIIPPEKRSKDLEGKTFVLTGTFSSMPRREAEKKIRMLGGNPASSVSKKTSFVVVGQNPGSKKMENAKEFGIKTITEEEFLEMLK